MNEQERSCGSIRTAASEGVDKSLNGTIRKTIEARCELGTADSAYTILSDDLKVKFAVLESAVVPKGQNVPKG